MWRVSAGRGVDQVSLDRSIVGGIYKTSFIYRNHNTTLRRVGWSLYMAPVTRRPDDLKLSTDIAIPGTRMRPYVHTQILP